MAHHPLLNLPDHVVDQILTKLRPQIDGPGRAAVAVIFAEGAPPNVCVLSGRPPALGDDTSFFQTVHRLWDNYEIGSVVPLLVLAYTTPPLVRVRAAALPWAAPNKKWCPQCGAALCGAALCGGACARKSPL